MHGSSTQQHRPTQTPTPWAEIGLLPLSVVVWVSALLNAVVRLASLAIGFPIEPPVYAAIVTGALVGAVGTVIQSYFAIPVLLRCLDLLGASALTTFFVILGSYLGLHPLYSLSLSATLAAWFLASYSSVVVWRVVPEGVPSRIDQILKERLQIESYRRVVFKGRESQRAVLLASRRIRDGLLILVLEIITLTALEYPIITLVNDPLFAFFAGILLLSLLSYYAFINLAFNQRMAETDKLQIAFSNYASVWGVAVAIPITCGLIAGILLPNLIRLSLPFDGSKWALSFANTVLALLFGKRRFASLYPDRELRDSPHTHFSGQGASGDPDTFSTVFWIQLALICLAIVIWLKNTDRERWKGSLHVLMSLLLWPFRWLKSVLRDGKPKSLGAIQNQNPHRNSTVGRRRFHPNDPAMFIRFVYHRFLRFAEEAGFPRRGSDTAFEFASRLTDHSGEIEELTNTYCLVRYGKPVLDPGIKGRALRLLRRVRRGLRHSSGGQEKH